MRHRRAPLPIDPADPAGSADPADPASRRALAAALACGALLALPAPDAGAAAFETCPTEAFLTQGSVPKTYAIDLLTGDHSIAAADHGTAKPLNAVGFNENDGHLYAWSRELGQPVRIHSDWRIEPLGDVNVTDTNNFYAGDVSTALNKYFVYRRDEAGLYAIDLDPGSDGHLTMERVGDAGGERPRIYDLAFHPGTGDAYAVDANGDLYRMDPSDGSFVELGDTGERGTFGAAYFDAEGHFYVGRNQDGQIFRIRVDSGEYRAEPFAKGPAASTNDGARCAGAPVTIAVSTEADYGDAPDSYATSLASNGPRHGRQTNPGLFLGKRVGAEADGYVHPLVDGTRQGNGKVKSDDDGAFLLSQPVAGERVLALVRASGEGFVSAWIDLGRDGRFDASDRVVADLAVRKGDNRVVFTLPGNLSPGQTWARVRLSTASGLEPTGGAPDGEVEDLQLTLLPGRTTVANYPSESGWATVAFEDNWPFVGDYDMNDLVVYLRTRTYRVGKYTTRIEIDGELAAVGASYANGFGIALPGVARDEVDEAGIEFTINGAPVTDRAALEPGRDQAILIVDENMRRYGADGEGCAYFRTEPGCGADIPMTFSLSVPFTGGGVDVPLSELMDPFLFATPGEWHGKHFASPPGRSYEIHLKNRAPTEAFNQALFANVGQDASDPARGLYFQSDKGMPWALAVGDRWDYPIEFRDVSEAYPNFIEFSTSSGAEAPFWYDPDAAEGQHLFTE